MAQAENNSPSRSALLTWLIFGVLGVAATLCGLVLPQGLRILQQPTAAVPSPQPAPQSGEVAVSPAQTKDTLEYEPPALPELPPLEPMFLRLALGRLCS